VALLHVPWRLQVIRVLQQRSMLPAIWFIMSRRDCDLSAIAAASDVELVTPDEAAALNDELQRLL
jgi:superfamily II RNA helicase